MKISELDDFAQLAFAGYKTLNRIQSRIYPTAFSTNENILVRNGSGEGGGLKDGLGGGGAEEVGGGMGWGAVGLCADRSWQNEHCYDHCAARGEKKNGKNNFTP